MINYWRCIIESYSYMACVVYVPWSMNEVRFIVLWENVHRAFIACAQIQTVLRSESSVPDPCAKRSEITISDVFYVIMRSCMGGLQGQENHGLHILHGILCKIYYNII